MSPMIDALEARRLFAFSDYAQLIGQDKALSQFPDVTGKGQTVAVIDTGIDYTHPYLGGGFGTGFKVKAGYDFVDNDADPRDVRADGHGTAVAGMIAGAKFTYLGVEYQGIAPDAELIALRTGTEANGFSDDNIQRALKWVINNRARYGINIVNLSLGGQSFTKEQVENNYADEFKQLRDAGVSIIAAAGNDGDIEGDSVGYPAADPLVYAIGSVSGGGQMSYFSDRGKEVDLVAPGEDVITTRVGGGTQTISGTSFSSPLVAGVFALLGQATGNRLSSADLLSVLRSSSTAQYDDDGDPGYQSDRVYAQVDIPAAIELAQLRARGGSIDYFRAAKDTVFDAKYDDQGVLHLAWQEPADQTLWYATQRTDGLWNSPVKVDPATGVAQALSLAISPAGRPAIAYYDGTRGDLKYAYFSGARWFSSVRDEKGTTGQQPSLTFTADGDPAIAYYRKSSSDLKLVSYDHLTGKWTRETIDNAGDVGKSPSIAYFRERTTPRGLLTVQNYDTLAIAYNDETNGDLKYWSRSTALNSVANYDGLGSPEQTLIGTKIQAGTPYVFRSTVDDLAGGVNHVVLDLLDVRGVAAPRIAYQDLANADVKYASRGRGAWDLLTVASTGAVGSSVDTYVDTTGSHHVVYYDYDRGASYNVGITQSVGLGVVQRIGLGGYTGSVAARADGSRVQFFGLSPNRKTFGATIIG